MTKYVNETYIKNGKEVNKKVIEKRLVFRNSYSIIPAPLKDFATMFNLNVHKEVMAYKLYTERNRNRVNVSALEFQIQYYQENKDKKSFEQIKKDWKQLIINAKFVKAFDEQNLTINIMKYLEFY